MALGMPDRGNAPFLWGRGGRRMTPEDIALRRRLAAQQMATGADFSPVQHWTQGLARVANGIAGGLQMRSADKAADARSDEMGSIAQILASGGEMPDGSDPIAAALAFPELQDMAELAYKRNNPGPVEPVIQRANNGDIIGINPMTGAVVFQHADPNPKPSLDWMSVKNEDGTTTLVPIGVSGPITGSPQTPAAPPATLPPDFNFGEPNIGNTPAPDLGANGMPTVLSREQYQAVVSSMGKAATDAWAARNNVVVRN